MREHRYNFFLTRFYQYLAEKNHPFDLSLTGVWIQLQTSYVIKQINHTRVANNNCIRLYLRFLFPGYYTVMWKNSSSQVRLQYYYYQTNWILIEYTVRPNTCVNEYKIKNIEKIIGCKNDFWKSKN